MTEGQFKKYREISDGLEPIKKFLFWCGIRYKNLSVGKYRFKIDAKKEKFNLLRIWHCWSIKENTYEIPVELQNRIIETIENYVEEKELELEKI